MKISNQPSERLEELLKEMRGLFSDAEIETVDKVISQLHRGEYCEFDQVMVRIMIEERISHIEEDERMRELVKEYNRISTEEILHNNPQINRVIR